MLRAFFNALKGNKKESESVETGNTVSGPAERMLYSRAVCDFLFAFEFFSAIKRNSPRTPGARVSETLTATSYRHHKKNCVTNAE